jgi:hypothetical protein
MKQGAHAHDHAHDHDHDAEWATEPLPPFSLPETRAATPVRTRAEREALLKAQLPERILLLDGAMGTMIQRERLDEAAYRGPRFADWHRDLRGNNDLLALTRPELIGAIDAYMTQRNATPKPRHPLISLVIYRNQTENWLHDVQ